MAVATSEEGSTVTAGIVWGWLRNKVSGARYGGLVCEYSGALSKKEAEKQLSRSLAELYSNGYCDEFLMEETRSAVVSFTPAKRYGTAVAALGFLTYVWPVIESGPGMAWSAGAVCGTETECCT